MADYGESALIDSAVMIGNPYHYHEQTSRMMSTMAGRFISRTCVKFMQYYAKRHLDYLKSVCPFHEEFFEAKFEHEFDDCMARMSGFKNGDDYYAQGSVDQRLHKIAKPTLILEAKDDPIVSCHGMNENKNPMVTQVKTKTGGHISFATDFWPNGPYWSDQIAADFLDIHCNVQSGDSWEKAVAALSKEE
eukprot:TRINITY_DN1340_c0_g1_i1.p1 TRINITY_DN1340_c0_g1~~TRINITY_DN1340_c0_g1_i1.p1  ORF type:complete len:190 (+),score=55.57 TRINITY_DN1340_c0_g1_i1:708-1277(+)